MNLNEIIDSLSEDALLNYVVVADNERKLYAKRNIAKRGPRIERNTYVIDITQLSHLLGIDPLMIHIDEHVFGIAKSKQLSTLYSIVDKQERAWM